MPPRIPLFQCLRAPTAQPTVQTTSRPFTTTPIPRASAVAALKRKHDPYFRAQAKARKAANLSRQEVLKKERAESLGDPVHGVTTPFVRAFDSGTLPVAASHRASTELRVDYSDEVVGWEEAVGVGKRRVPTEENLPNGEEAARSTDEGADELLFTNSSNTLNFFLTTPELHSGIQRSQALTDPDASSSSSSNTESIEDYTSTLDASERAALRSRDQTTATEALERISALSLGSGADKKRTNIARCIQAFGRHNTDHFLTSTSAPSTTIAETTSESADDASVFPRQGSDTGSSEVQIAILTARIRSVSELLKTRGRGDKMNKRNLRLLVHRRQKLLIYLRRKDRGGSRWQHCVNTLGLTEGTWRGEISL